MLSLEGLAQLLDDVLWLRVVRDAEEPDPRSLILGAVGREPGEAGREGAHREVRRRVRACVR